MVEYWNSVRETEETVGTSYGVTLMYRTNESNTATMASHNLGVDTVNRKHEWLHTVMNTENRNMQRIMSEGSRQTNNKMKEQIKNILMSGKAKVIKLSKSDRHLPRNCKLYRFQCGWCKKKFKQKFLLNKHLKNRACTKQDFSCPYCDQRFSHSKSVSKHIQKNMCHYVNNYMLTKDKTVFFV